MGGENTTESRTKNKEENSKLYNTHLETNNCWICPGMCKMYVPPSSLCFKLAVPLMDDSELLLPPKI